MKGPLVHEVEANLTLSPVHTRVMSLTRVTRWHQAPSRLFHFDAHT